MQQSNFQITVTRRRATMHPTSDTSIPRSDGILLLSRMLQTIVLGILGDNSVARLTSDQPKSREIRDDLSADAPPLGSYNKMNEAPIEFLEVWRRIDSPLYSRQLRYLKRIRHTSRDRVASIIASFRHVSDRSLRVRRVFSPARCESRARTRLGSVESSDGRLVQCINRGTISVGIRDRCTSRPASWRRVGRVQQAPYMSVASLNLSRVNPARDKVSGVPNLAAVDRLIVSTGRRECDQTT